MGRSKGWQVPLSQMVPAGHWSSRAQSGPALTGATGLSAAGGAAGAGSGFAAGSGVPSAADFVAGAAEAGSSSACATWKGESDGAARAAKGSRLGTAQTGRGDREATAQPSVATSRGR